MWDKLQKTYAWNHEQVKLYDDLIAAISDGTNPYERDCAFFKGKVRDTEAEIRAVAPARTDGVIDIIGSERVRKHYEPLDKEYYFIALHDGQIIGHISYRGLHSSNYGDIGYEIDEEYRGNGLAYRALCLLGEILLENGINEAWIAAEGDNIASIKTIEKYGGTHIGESLDNKGKPMALYSLAIMKKELQGTARQFARPQS